MFMSVYIELLRNSVSKMFSNKNHGDLCVHYNCITFALIDNSEQIIDTFLNFNFESKNATETILLEGCKLFNLFSTKSDIKCDALAIFVIVHKLVVSATNNCI